MTEYRYFAGRALGTSGTGSQFINISGGLNTSDSLVRAKLYASLTAQNLETYFSANTDTAATDVYLRKTGSDTALTVSAPSSTSGRYEDTTHTVSFVSGDLVNIRVLQNGTGATTSVSAVSLSGSDSHYINAGGNTNSSGVDNYEHASGGTFAASTESIEQSYVNGAPTFSSASTYCGTFSVTGGTPSNVFRINGADTSISISITSTGVFEDTSHTATAADTDKLAWVLRRGGTGGSVQTWSHSMLAASFARMQQGTLSAVSVNADRYTALNAASFVTSEADIKLTARSTETAANSYLYAGSNTLSGANMLVVLRQNGSNTSLSITVTAGVTGWHSDTTHTVALSATDLINMYYNKNGASGTLMPYVVSIDLPTAVAAASLPEGERVEAARPLPAKRGLQVDELRPTLTIGMPEALPEASQRVTTAFVPRRLMRIIDQVTASPFVTGLIHTPPEGKAYSETTYRARRGRLDLYEAPPQLLGIPDPPAAPGRQQTERIDPIRRGRLDLATQPPLNLGVFHTPPPGLASELPPLPIKRGRPDQVSAPPLTLGVPDETTPPPPGDQWDQPVRPIKRGRLDWLEAPPITLGIPDPPAAPGRQQLERVEPIRRGRPDQVTDAPPLTLGVPDEALARPPGTQSYERVLPIARGRLDQVTAPPAAMGVFHTPPPGKGYTETTYRRPQPGGNGYVNTMPRAVESVASAVPPRRYETYGPQFGRRPQMLPDLSRWFFLEEPAVPALPRPKLGLPRGTTRDAQLPRGSARAGSYPLSGGILPRGTTRGPH